MAGTLYRRQMYLQRLAQRHRVNEDPIRRTSVYFADSGGVLLQLGAVLIGQTRGKQSRIIPLGTADTIGFVIGYGNASVRIFTQQIDGALNIQRSVAQRLTQGRLARQRCQRHKPREAELPPHHRRTAHLREESARKKAADRIPIQDGGSAGIQIPRILQTRKLGVRSVGTNAVVIAELQKQVHCRTPLGGGRLAALGKQKLKFVRSCRPEQADGLAHGIGRPGITAAEATLGIRQFALIAHRQIGTHLSIPAKYYERMRSEDPGLLAHNVNTWLERTPAQRMIRVLDGKARAYLSNRYLRMDNYSIASAVLPILAEIPDVRIESCQITDSRMYIKAVNPRLQEDVTPGDTVQAGVVISNSEVGLGSVNIQPLIYRLVCSNGMVVNDAATKRNHIGRATDAEENFQLYSEKTLAADDHAFLLKVQDTVRAAAEEARFAQVVGMMREAAAVPMNTADVPGVVKLASRQFGLTDSEGEGILQHLIEGHDLSLYGLSNAVTRYSQDVSSYDRASDLEIIGYNILAMPRSVWSRLNQVSAA